MLYPKITNSRNLINLSGVWNFKADYREEGYKNHWYKNGLKDYELMPVPASYNDITVDAKLRDFVGDVWYEKKIVIPKPWQNENVFIRVGSASHNSKAWINGILVKEYTGGFLPFESNLENAIKYGEENHIVICVNNELTWQTFPPGEVYYFEDADGNKKKKQRQQHDFFNYSGIHRHVYLYTTPKTYVKDITIKTDFEESLGKIHYDVITNKIAEEIKIEVYDEENQLVAVSTGESGKIEIKNVKLWKPNNAYLYSFVVKLNSNHTLIDQYSLNIGIRKVQVKDGQFLINNEPFYFKGFGKHEDMDVKGKGLDDAINIRDFNLLKWINANSFRTSHYPYAEEVLDLADRYGIVIIDEVPAVGMLGQAVPAVGELDGVFTEEKINNESLKEHIRLTREMIARDKNHPSVVMWSLANEASVMEPKAESYFQKLVEETRKIDDRPLLNVNLMLIEPGKCNVSKYFDVIGLNLYFGWYSERGDIDAGKKRLMKWLKDCYEADNKPILLSEYGVDTVAGLHKEPAIMFSEEFQVHFLKAYHEIFDQLPFVIGEHVWNFADFMTGQDIVRVDGNKKGVFTRQRQPKMAAHYLRERWGSLKNTYTK
ncbi:beta-glucuronidase [Alkaliphilus peptidifermentans]|uniref:Beta-glucuronidase n=1 Tax=Alkaliphilus peptidifermentans DSM 18978 TaxID=1120976 RepID=A0A1G5CBC7_9FIRM|nr:beta-glucuronidase [Alkaliphilus peptidifermentans]SCX99712.1 beta-glucuronidase [Alkaliphilus peptidifermentans DSM 18978]